MQKGAQDSEKVERKQGREKPRRQGREAREARMEIREAKAVERQGKNKHSLERCGSRPKKQRSSGIGSPERRGKRARVSDVETIGDNKLVMATGSRKRGGPDVMGGRQRKTSDKKENRERQA